MKDIKLSFPYPSTSRHNLSQDVSTSLSMGLVTPVRIVKVLPGDSHRIATSFSLVSNPLVKPLLQGVRMRYCRFWVPSRIYNLDQRANNSNYDPLNQSVRHGVINGLTLPYYSSETESSTLLGYYSNFQQSSLFDYLGIAPIESNLILDGTVPDRPTGLRVPYSEFFFNAEPYLAYIDICRNYFADSASGMIAWSSIIARSSSVNVPLDTLRVCVSPLKYLDSYIDGIQNSRGVVVPYDYSKDFSSAVPDSFVPFVRTSTNLDSSYVPIFPSSDSFRNSLFGIAHAGLCVPMNRPDRLSRLFDTRPLVSQNATVSPNEITMGNLSFLSKLQRYLTRRFFGGSRFTDIMYSVFGQKVPHVDSPVLLDVFDTEIGSELVASTNATQDQNPGVLGGYFQSAGVFSSSRGRSRKRYTFNENGYLFDVVYILPRLNRTSFLPDFYPVSRIGTTDEYSMSQGNFVPDFNGIGWQQPAFVSKFLTVDSEFLVGSPVSFCCEPSWQQYRTLPDVCHGALNPLRSVPNVTNSFTSIPPSLELNSPLFTFNDRMDGSNGFTGVTNVSRSLLAHYYFSDFNDLNRVFGVSELTFDNFFVVFRYSHQVKSQVSKRFTLTFN